MSGTRDESAIEAMVDSWLSEDAPSGTDTTQTNDTQEGGEGGEQGSAPQEGQGTAQQPAAADGKQNNAPDPAAKPPGGKERDAQQAPKAQPGDLVDRDGKVLARAGAERRHYEAAQRATREVQQARGELERLNTELTAYKQASGLPQQLGLTVEDTATGLQLVASWKQNPVGVIEYLVAQAKAAGHNIDGIGGTADLGAIKTMLDQRLAPLHQQQEQARLQQQTQLEAQRQIHALVNEYGESALVNSEALSKIIDAAHGQGKQMGLEQAFLRFNNWCLQNGYDPQQPIDPQIAAKNSQPAQTAQQPQPRMPPSPNGRAVAAPNGVREIDPAAGMTGDESMRDIVRASMREAGYQI